MNPFTLVPYSGEEYFCDRNDETQDILSAIKSKRNLALHSIRRLGKTGLIFHVQQKLPKRYVPVYLDILDTQNEMDFANKFISSVISSLENKRSIVQKSLQLFARFRASVVLDPTTGLPTVSLDIKEPREVNLSLQLLWKLIKEEKNKQFQIAIDEFQKVADYPFKSIDATVRGAIQTIPNLHFIFSGSQQHLLTGLFADASRPLFRTTELYELQSISYPAYLQFIQSMFTNHKKSISDQHIHQILDWTNLHTYYVQYFFHLLFVKIGKSINDRDIEKIKNHIYIENEGVYYQFKRLLTGPQWKLLSAVAHEGILTQPTSSAIREKYILGAPATVSRSLESLLEKEMIYMKMNRGGIPQYIVYDIFLSRWIVHRAL